jgi:hypothetical protein
MNERDRKTPAVLTIVTTLGFFSILAWLITNGLPDTGRDAVLVMLGTLGTAWTACVSYYVGSTAGSARKTEAMERMAGGGNQP